IRQKAGLRLDTAALIRRGGESGPAIEPGQSDASLLIDRVTAAEVAERMPPESEGTKLSPAEVAALRAWIDQGADAPPPPTPQAPAVPRRPRPGEAPPPPPPAAPRRARPPRAALPRRCTARPRAGPGPASRQGSLASPRLYRPDRPTPDARTDSCVPR